MNRRFLILSLLLVGFSPQAVSQVSSSGFPSGWRMELEVGRHAFPGSFNDFFGLANWNQKYMIRLGFGKNVFRHISASAFAEYRKYESETRYGDMFPRIFLRSYSRTEVACYVSLTLLGFLEGGVGGILQSHEELVSYQPNFGIPTYQYQIQPAAQRVRLFYVAAVKYEIPLGGGYYVPVVLSMDQFLGEYDIQQPALRIGISKEFK